MMLYRVSACDFTAQPMPQGLWRDFLTLEHVAKLKSFNEGGNSGGSSRGSSQNRSNNGGRSSESTKSSKHRQNAQDFLQNCLNAAEGVELVSSDGQLEWNGKAVESPDDMEREEILWELAELNFRFELCALDSRATTADPGSRQELIAACFPGGRDGTASLLVADLGAANHGLASENWEEKAPYLQALRKVVATWRGEIPRIIQTEKYHWAKQEIQDLENVVASFYVLSFYNHFHRAPVLPRGLSHQASLFHMPPPPKVKVLDPRPNTFYDVSVFSIPENTN
jgi:hypothetical protein